MVSTKTHALVLAVFASVVVVLGQNHPPLCGYKFGFLECDPRNGVGVCCHKSGVCGSSFEFCGYGNGSASSIGPKWPVDNVNQTCGKDHDFAVCRGSYGGCCSKRGFCGNTEAHCSVDRGCQSGCTPITGLNRCGRAFGNKTCANNPWGSCCSVDGFCGESDGHCLLSQGCQSGCKGVLKPTCPSDNGCPAIDGTMKKFNEVMYRFYCNQSVITGGPNPTLNGTLEQCMQRCAADSSCKGVSHRGTDCYLVYMAAGAQSLQRQDCWLSALPVPDKEVYKCCAKGEKGDKGDKGDRGEKGLKGDQGEKGPKGDKGEAGQKGNKGARGDKGPKGDRGSPGGGSKPVAKTPPTLPQCPGSVPSVVTVSGARFAIYPDCGHRGANYGWKKVRTAKDCAQLCATDKIHPPCRGATFYEKYKSCRMYGEPTNPVQAAAGTGALVVRL